MNITATIRSARTPGRDVHGGLRRFQSSGATGRVLRHLLVGFLWLLLPGAVFAQHDGHASMEHAHADMDMSGPRALGAAAAFDTHGRLWVVSVREGHVVLRHSDDFGKTLSAPTEVNAQAQKISASQENHPAIAIGPEGQLYVTWVNPLAQKWASQVWFARSTDAGEHFSAPVRVHRDSTPITHSFNALAVDGSGRVVVAWIDSRDRAAAMAQDKPYRGLSIYYAWSSDEGQTFDAERRLVEHSCECCRLALAPTPEGKVAALFRMNYPGNIRDHALTLLPAAGEPLEPQRVTFSDWKIAACPEQGPGLAIGADGVRHAVWYQAAHGPAISYGQLQAGQKPGHLLPIGGPGAGHAVVAVHADKVWLVWNQVDANGYQLMARSSRDGGKHFGPATAIASSTAAVYSPQLLVHAGDAYAAWNTADGFRLIRVATDTGTTP